MADSHAEVLVSYRDGRLDLCINRPDKRNALSSNVMRELKSVLRLMAERPDIRLLVITGAGEKSFAAGGDLKELSAVRTLEQATSMSVEYGSTLAAIRDFPVPVVAAVNGDALGGGAELAAACSFRIASAHARIGFVQSRLAITSAWGGGPDLHSILGPTRAMRLLATGEIMSAAEAARIGLVDDVAIDLPLGEAVERFVAPMLQAPRQVLTAIKALNAAFRRGASRSELERIETAGFAAAWVHQDHWTAADQVLNRKPAPR